MTEKRCPACNAKLFMVANAASGRMLPLQKVANVYIVGDDGLAHATDKAVQRYVSHFETCTDPARFSREREKS